MRVFISGFCGYIGTAATQALRQVAGGVEILGLDAKNGEGEDLLGPGCLDFVADWGPDVIVNLAGVSGEKAAREVSWSSGSWETNAELPSRLLQTLKPGGLFVQAGTCSSYDPQWAKSLYARSKTEAEGKLGRAAGRRDDCGLILARFGTLVGYNEDCMRWDLPLHRMVFDAVDKGVISIPAERMDRPWLRLEDLCAVLQRWCGDHLAGLEIRHDWPLPLVTVNATLEHVAGGVQALTQCKIERHESDDKRSYAAPMLLGSSEYVRRNKDFHNTIEELVEKAYEKSVSEAAQPADPDGEVPEGDA